MVDAEFSEFQLHNITFYYQTLLPLDGNEGKTLDWIDSICSANGFSVSALNYIFCSDEQLHKINLEHLNHDTYTDIITFDYSDENKVIESDIYISIDRVNENACEFKVGIVEELHRVLIHGLLHLFGYGDKSEGEKIEMREKENACLSLRKI